MMWMLYTLVVGLIIGTSFGLGIASLGTRDGLKESFMKKGGRNPPPPEGAKPPPNPPGQRIHK